MVLALLKLIGGLIVLYLGAEGLVRGSAGLATRLGLKPLIVGLTIVAFGTSSPELIVSIKSALDGFAGLAVGNVIGSNICNVALILGCTALVTPLQANHLVVKRDTPFMIVISLIAAFIIFNLKVARWEAMLLFALFLIYNIVTIILSLKEGNQESENAAKEAAFINNIFLLIVMTIAGLGLLFWGSNILVKESVWIARFLGISETIIGISMLAVGTSIPELAAAIVAAFQKKADIVVGTIIGSNIFNIGLVLGLTGIVTPFQIQGLELINIYVMLGVSLLILPFLWSGFILNRLEGAILICCYGGYIFYIWH